MSANQDNADKTVAADIHWLESPSQKFFGTTFGLPWSRESIFHDRTTFTCLGKSGNEIPIQSWITAYWSDGSVKWTAHAIPASPAEEYGYTVHASVKDKYSQREMSKNQAEPSITVTEDSIENFIEVKTGRITVRFSTWGNAIIQSITNSSGNTTAENGRLVLLSQSSLPEEDNPDHCAIHYEFEGKIDEVVVEQSGPVRTVIAIKGRHRTVEEPDGYGSHDPWLPFILRFYLYENSEVIRMVHTIVYDGDMNTDFVRGMGIRFDVPLENEALYDRHIRIAGVNGGTLSESIQGITGLRRDPGKDIRLAQVAGEPTPPLKEWDKSVSSRIQWVPSWDDYSLSQLSSDGFTLRKRTKVGCSWVNIPGGTQSEGLAYLGGATRGGLAVGLKNFWERYPTGLDIRNATSDTGTITIWLYSPSAQPMDLRQYHDGLGQDTFADQLDALNITYEDWEPETGSPYGIARTNEVYIFSLSHTPDSEEFAKLAANTRNPPVLVSTPEVIYQTKAFGTSWLPASNMSRCSPIATSVESNLSFLFNFHKSQISQRRWYGFWDHGDIMHAYDSDRHTWRYDIGGYAWDNSELSPDLWLWLYFLQTGRADVYRLAEALTRHTGEVDICHIGKHRGLGARHGVQHWSDSCKQARISNALYRKYFYYLSGGDERVGDLVQEVLDTDKTFLTLDPYRKVRKDKETYIPDATALSISLGTDWASLAAAWLIETERRGPRWKEAEGKLLASIGSIGKLANGFITGTANYNLSTGEISPPPSDADNKGVVQISHLSAMFGLFEVCAEIMDTYSSEITGKFEEAWLEYCKYFNGTAEEQIKRFDISFGKLQLRQGHSRLTAYAGTRLGDEKLKARAWEEFELKGEWGPEDGYGPETTWKTEKVKTHEALVPVDEAVWVSTNITALYCIAAIQNLALVGDQLDSIK